MHCLRIKFMYVLWFRGIEVLSMSTTVVMNHLVGLPGVTMSISYVRFSFQIPSVCSLFPSSMTFWKFHSVRLPAYPIYRFATRRIRILQRFEKPTKRRYINSGYGNFWNLVKCSWHLRTGIIPLRRSMHNVNADRVSTSRFRINSNLNGLIKKVVNCRFLYSPRGALNWPSLGNPQYALLPIRQHQNANPHAKQA